MNSLEFIDKEIEQIEREIKYKKLYIENNPNDNSLRLEMISIMISSLEEKLVHLQQIKSELEAWEIAKERVEIIEAVTTFASSTYAKETTPIIGNTEPVEIRISIIGKDKIKTFIKALEVKENVD